MTCRRCQLLIAGDQQLCGLCAAELEGVSLLRCDEDSLGRLIRRIFTRKRGGLSLRRAACTP